MRSMALLHTVNANNEICTLSGQQQFHVSCTACCKQAYGTYRPIWQLLPQPAAVTASSQPTAYPADRHLPQTSCIHCTRPMHAVMKLLQCSEWKELMTWPQEENGGPVAFTKHGKSVYVQSSLGYDTTRLLQVCGSQLAPAECFSSFTFFCIRILHMPQAAE